MRLTGGLLSAGHLCVKRRENVDGAFELGRRTWHSSQVNERPRQGSTSRSARAAAGPATRSLWCAVSRYRQPLSPARHTDSRTGRGTTADEASKTGTEAGGDAPPPAAELVIIRKPDSELLVERALENGGK